MKIICFLIFLVSCSHTELKVNGEVKKNLKVISHKKYKEIKGAGNALQNVSGATLLITFRQTGKQKHPQDLIAFSIGKKDPSYASRASLRIDKGGYLTGVARATDTEEAQNVRAKEKVNTGEFHKAALVVDYANNLMQLYLDGKPLESEGKVEFKADTTDNTPSIHASLGAEDDGSAFYFQGELKDPMIWGRSLSPEEVLIYSQD